jgi:hypothetical protein
MNGVGIINLATSKSLVVKSTMFPHKPFINTAGPLMIGTVNTQPDLSHTDRWKEFEYARRTIF